MTSEDAKKRELERLQSLLDVYGGDRDRWPLRERLGVAEYVAKNPEAAQLVREAQLLDRLIEGSHLQAPQRQSQSRDLARLSERILAEARADRLQAASAGEQQPQVVHLVRRPVQSRFWQAAGLLAACLVIGIMVGRSGVLFADSMQITQSAGVDDSLAGFLRDEGSNFAEEDMI